ncbi:MAG: succinyl-diaminopimelate desuccinylase [Planctomycetota bacterium]|jgi:succinyl-diaminopimelate desuccinylase
MSWSETVELARDLIRRPSLSPDDQGCQDLIAQRLEAAGFTVERADFEDTKNLWAHHGEGEPVLALLGHTDVVPPGPLESWTHPPFGAVIDEEGILHGRGAADMKGGLAALVTAAAAFVRERPAHAGKLALLITSDEEGRAKYGTRRVVEWLEERGQGIDLCIVGEPSSTERFGDTIKNGRRGSLTGFLTVHGVQGHVAYPHRALNPIYAFAPALAELATTIWDEGNEYFPPTTFQISNVHAGTGAVNVIPGLLEVTFNWRFSTEQTDEGLKQRLREVLDRHGFRYELRFRLSGQPFLTAGGPLLEAAVEAVEAATSARPELSTSGGTSDGRFIAPMGAQVIELGPINQTIHKANEQVCAKDLDSLHRIYGEVLARILT